MAGARTVDPATATGIRKPRIVERLLVDMDFQGGHVRLWTGVGPLTWGPGTFQGVGSLGSVDQVQETTDGAANGINLVLSGQDPAIMAACESESIQGRTVLVWYALMAPGGKVIIGQPIRIAKKYMDTMLLEREERSLTITLSAETYPFDMSRVDARYYSDADQQSEYPGDRLFEFYPGMKTIKIKWGEGEKGSK